MKRIFNPSFIQSVGLFWIFIQMVFFLGCGNPQDSKFASINYSEEANIEYSSAMEAFSEKDWITARVRMENVKQKFSFSPFARLAELRLADILVEEGKPEEATVAYREYVRAHRSDKNVEYAKFKLIKTLFFDIDDNIFLPSQEERDQKSIQETHQEVLSFRKSYPKSRFGTEIDYILDVLQVRMMRHELYVAKYYLKEGKYDAAISRIDYALKHYSEASSKYEALLLKGELLLKKGKLEEAKFIFTSLLQAPNRYEKAAQKFLAFIETTHKQ